MPSARSALTVVTLLSLAPMMTARVTAQCPAQKLIPADGATGNWFGRAVALSGDRLVVGAYHDDQLGLNAGAAYVFRELGSSWIEEAKLVAEDGALFDFFGGAVAIAGNRIIVGAIGDDGPGNNAGAAYVFERLGLTWTQVAKLTASDPAQVEEFGISVAIGGDFAIVGAWRDGPNTRGAAYTFERIGGSWVSDQKLLASDQQPGARFGFAVALSGSTAVVGALRHSVISGAFHHGKVYVFDRVGSSWVEGAQLVASDAVPGANFGGSVSIAGSRILIGALNNDELGLASGSAYVFDLIGVDWVETTKLLASDGAELDQFGFSVAVSGDRALVAAPFDDDSGGSSGSVYVFGHDGSQWNEDAKLTPADGFTFDFFGYSVALDGAAGVASSPLDDPSGGDSGSVYLIDMDATTCDAFQRGDCNGDGTLNALTDGLFLLTFGFLGGPPPPCDDAADANDDGVINALADGLYVLQFGFLQGPPPPAPFPCCGADPTDDDLECAVSACP